MDPLYCDPARLRAQLGRPLVLGHRGLAGDQVENRLAAFRGALGLGADGVELDIQLSVDRVPMVLHDADLQRTAGRPEKVRELTADELEGLGVDSLETVLRGLGPRAIVNVEVKDLRVRESGIERLAVELVRALGMQDRVLFSSFNPWAVRRIRRLDPRLYVAQLTGPGVLRGLRLASPGDLPAIHPHLSEVGDETLRAWRRAGRRIVVWGDRSLEQLAACLKLDVDGVITDRPGEAVRLRERAL